jgi:hypothetical protein
LRQLDSDLRIVSSIGHSHDPCNHSGLVIQKAPKPEAERFPNIPGVISERIGQVFVSLEEQYSMH